MKHAYGAAAASGHRALAVALTAVLYSVTAANLSQSMLESQGAAFGDRAVVVEQGAAPRGPGKRCPLAVTAADKRDVVPLGLSQKSV